ncbi:MgtC/SapB family protein [Nostocaceae cyanobacterium CENA369]|uniref:MgtC/SapB family protein n=1 Tax=Dendronalium phyllosphericum CENA369 TaxID=1725256 RepID=A0A8J7I027_9NOST|nr:MgtC/SapB family protein [Dendronalium phyllosphericum]MBH8572245.1 MgtC/SapB family protein [Dendronalium phyllosphericum CENA369]
MSLYGLSAYLLPSQLMDISFQYWISVAPTNDLASSIFSGTLHTYSIKRLSLALVIGLFVGLEREWRHKHTGVRTFGFVSLLGGLGGILGENYALLCIALLGLLIVFLNLQTLRVGKGTELTTSTALLVIGLAGVLCGQGHTVTPVAVAVIAAALLSWKESLKGFSLGLSEPELKSAIMLAMLTFVIYPALPSGTIDPWGLVQLREAWLTVILVAGIGFVNYVLWKIYGTRGIQVASFLGGLVNSSVAVVELAKRVHETQGRLNEVAYRGIVLATIAMVLRNAVLLAILSPHTLQSSAPALALMLAGSVGLTLIHRQAVQTASRPLEVDQGNNLAIETTHTLNFESPFSLKSALKFGLIFLALQIAAVLAQKALGQFGFYSVSIVGGLISSASAVASAATLAAHGTLSANEAGTGAVFASVASVLVNLPLVARISHERQLTKRLTVAMLLIVTLGIVGTLFPV